MHEHRAGKEVMQHLQFVFGPGTHSDPAGRGRRWQNNAEEPALALLKKAEATVNPAVPDPARPETHGPRTVWHPASGTRTAVHVDPDSPQP